MFRPSHITLEIEHKFIKDLEEIMISHENKTRICYDTTPDQSAFISNSGSFDTRLMVKYAQVFKTKMVLLKPWRVSACENYISLKKKKKISFNLLKIQPIKFPYKVGLESIWNCWLWGYYKDRFADGEYYALFPISYFKFIILSI